MFGVEKLITLIERHECIWNCREKSFESGARIRAWQEVGKSFCEDWDSFSEETKKKSIEELQKKWKNLRQYYRSVQRDEKRRKSIGAKRRKPNPYFYMLTFLPTVQEDRNSDGDNSDPMDGNCDTPSLTEKGESLPSKSSQNPTEKGDSLPSKSSQNPAEKDESLPSNPSQNSTETLQNSHRKKRKIRAYWDRESSESDHDKQFLLSLLPEMRTMTQAQNFEFRFGIMSLLKVIKYSSSDSQLVSVEPITYTTARETHRQSPRNCYTSASSSCASFDASEEDTDNFMEEINNDLSVL